jgi:hypothetical protein
VDPAIELRRSRHRLLLSKSLMRPCGIVEADVLDHELTKVVLPEDEDMIEPLAAARARGARGAVRITLVPSLLRE